jgi:hypothetical protein
MKFFITIFILLLCIFQTFGQDVINCISGQLIECKIIRTDSIEVHYQFFTNGNKYKSSIAWDKVEKIVFADGYTAYSNRILAREPKVQISKVENANVADKSSVQMEENLKSAISIGFLHGGGSLIGADIEFMAGERASIQFGGGLGAFGAGLNVHFKKNDIRSSMLSVQYWKQGFGDNFVQSLIGPNIVIRAKRIFTATLGVGYVLETGRNSIATPNSFILTYAIGAYFPF